MTFAHTILAIEAHRNEIERRRRMSNAADDDAPHSDDDPADDGVQLANGDVADDDAADGDVVRVEVRNLVANGV
jgi:hypothetical protein